MKTRLMRGILFAVFLLNAPGIGAVKLVPGVPLPLTKIFPDVAQYDPDIPYWYLAIQEPNEPLSTKRATLYGGTPGKGLLFGVEYDFRYYDEGIDPYHLTKFYGSISSGSVFVPIDFTGNCTNPPSLCLNKVVLQKAVKDSSPAGFHRQNVYNAATIAVTVGKDMPVYQITPIKKDSGLLETFYGKAREWVGEDDKTFEMIHTRPVGGVRGGVSIIGTELVESSPAAFSANMQVADNGILDFLFAVGNAGDGDNLFVYINGELAWDAPLAGLSTNADLLGDTFYEGNIELPALAGQEALVTFYLDSVGAPNARVSVVESLSVTAIPEPFVFQSMIVGLGVLLLTVGRRRATVPRAFP